MEPASLSAEDLATRAGSPGLTAEIVPDQPGPRRVLITGSLYLDGNVLVENA